ncbi:transposase [Streptomyces sp. MS2.AVA.5]|uniref:Transposase n=1 Tax=Streptomyces achmelvichensis TaxID=3134111 RepID=A0ACC6PL68_9ACTN
MSDHVRQVTEMITEIEGLNNRVRGLETTIRELVTPLAPALLEITGISHISAAALLAEIGDLTRFASSAKLARHTGTAPIPVCSSDKERYRLHRGGNRRRKEQRRAVSIHHIVSKEVVTEAERASRGVALEDLGGIRQRVRLRKVPTGHAPLLGLGPARSVP